MSPGGRGAAPHRAIGRRPAAALGQVLGLLGALASLAAGPGAQAAGLRDVDDGWLLQPGESAAWLRDAPAHQGAADPTAAAGSWCAAGRAQLFCLPELTMDYLALRMRPGAGTVPGEILLCWQRTGGGLLREDSVRAGIGAGGRTRVSILWAWCRAEVGGQGIGSLQTVHAQIGRSFALTEGWHFRQEVGCDLWQAGAGAPAACARKGRTVLCGPQAVLAVAWDRDREGALRPGLDVLVPLTAQAGVSLRAEPASGSLGPGLVLRRGPLLLLTSHVQHPALGATHRFMLAVGDWGGRTW